METNFALDDLFDHLVARCSGPPGRAAAGRWRAAEPALAGITDPLDALAACNSRCEPRRSNEALGALVRLGASDELAALTALVALVPGLGAIASRLRRCVGLESDSLDADLASAAWEAIRSLGQSAEEAQWPARVILNRTRAQLRARARTEARRRGLALDDPQGALESIPGGQRGPALDTLGAALGALWRAHPDARSEVELVFASRVWGTPSAALATQAGADVGALRARRARAERCVARAAQRGVIGIWFQDDLCPVGGGR